jgi:hypothetical protein
MELLPDELVCHILSYVTDWDDIVAVMTASRHLQTLAQSSSGIRQIKTASSRVIPVKEVTGFTELRHIDVPVLVSQPEELSDLLTLVKLNHLRIQMDVDFSLALFRGEIYGRPLINFVCLYHQLHPAYYMEVCDYHGHTIVRRHHDQITLQTNLIGDLPRGLLHELSIDTLIYTDSMALSIFNHCFKKVQHLVLHYNGDVQEIRETLKYVTQSWSGLRSIRLHLDCSGGSSNSAAKANLLWRLLTWDLNLAENSRIDHFDVPINPMRLGYLCGRFPMVKGWTLLLENVADLDQLDDKFTYKILVPLAFAGKTLPERANFSYEFL